MESSCDYLTAF